MHSNWTALLIAATTAGMALCASLVARRRVSGACALLAIILLAISVSQMVGIGTYTRSAGVGVTATLIGLGALAGGFLLAAALVPSVTRVRPKPRTAAGRESPQPAVIIVAHGQPEHYDPSVTTQSFDRLASSGVSLPPLALRVFGYVSDRSRYRSAGINPTRLVVRAVSGRVKDLLRERGFNGNVFEAWLEGTPRLCDAMAAAREDGANEVAVVLFDVAECYEYDLALREIGAACDVSGMTWTTSAPLWPDEALARLVCEKVVATLPGGPRKSDGVVVVAGGQPPAWDRSHPQGTEQQTFFSQRVRALLVEQGLESPNIRIAWLDWHEPDVTEVVRHLSAVGCERIVVVPATFVADTLEVAVDLPAAVSSASPDPSVRVDVLHGWGDDERVAEVVVASALETLAELGWPERDEDAGFDGDAGLGCPAEADTQ